MMRATQIIRLLAVLALGSACVPTTTVVVLPDDDGRVGQVTVSTARESRTIAADSDYLEATDSLSPVEKMDAGTIQDRFGPALAAQPDRPVSHLIYFGTGSADPLPDSRQGISAIARFIKNRPLAEITLIGHTDQVGDLDFNLKLSLARAETVRKLLVRHGIATRQMQTASYGYNAPLVPAVPGMPEPRNRRVEVFVR